MAYFNSFSLTNLECEIEDYGRECYEEGFEDGRNTALEDIGRYGRDDGLVSREHYYKGEKVITWIEGPDFKGDRYAW